MPKVTALIHTSNDASGIGRALESLRVCNQLLVIDHQSNDETAKIAAEHGATVKPAIQGVGDGAYVVDVQHDWVLCLLPSEALSQMLQESISAWKESDPASATGFAMKLLEQTENSWHNDVVQMRLVDRRKINWTGALPPNCKAPQFEGELLRFRE